MSGYPTKSELNAFGENAMSVFAGDINPIGKADLGDGVRGIARGRYYPALKLGQEINGSSQLT